MERAIAIKKLRKLLGKTLGYRIDPRAPTPEEREVAKAALPALVEARDKLKEQAKARYNAILAADAEYQSLKAAREAASKQVDELFSLTRHYKITVGLSGSIFFHIKAEGDSWEDVIDKLTTGAPSEATITPIDAQEG